MQLKQSEYLKSVQKYKVNCDIIIIYIVVKMYSLKMVS